MALVSRMKIVHVRRVHPTWQIAFDSYFKNMNKKKKKQRQIDMRMIIAQSYAADCHATFKYFAFEISYTDDEYIIKLLLMRCRSPRCIKGIRHELAKFYKTSYMPDKLKRVLAALPR